MTQLIQSPPPVFQPLESQTLAFSSDWKISRKIFQASEFLAPIFPGLGKTAGSRFQGLEKCLRRVGVLLALSACGCVSSQLPEKQSADRYRAIMREWHKEMNARLSTFFIQFKQFPEGRATPPAEKQKQQALFIEYYQTWSKISGKYADKLAAEKPAPSFEFPFVKTHEMFTIIRDMGSECARLLEANDDSQAGAVERQKGDLSHACGLELEQWFKAHNLAELCKLFELDAVNEGIRNYQKTHLSPKPEK